MDKLVASGVMTVSENRHEKWLLEHPDSDFDGDGLTNAEEKELGTSPFEIDTSGNGVTDYDAVKVYKTDPLQYSSSGDGISDASKIHFGLDVNSQYSETEVAAILANIEIFEEDNTMHLIPDDLDSAALYVYEDYEASALKNIAGLGQVKVLFHFNGDVEMDTSYLKEGNIEGTDELRIVEVHEKGALHEVSNWIMDGDTVRFRVQSGVPFAIQYVSDEKVNWWIKMLTEWSKNIDIGGGNQFRVVAVRNLPIGKDYLMVLGDLLQIEHGEAYDSLDFNVVTAAAPEVAFKVYDFLFDVCYPEMAGIFVPEEGKTPRESFYANLEPMMRFFMFYDKYEGSLEEIVADLNSEFPNYHFTLDGKKILVDGNYNKVIGMDEPLDDEHGTYNVTTDFKVNRDGFNFSNIRSEIGNGGLCAGYSYLAMKLYHGNQNEKGSIEGYSGEDIAYDLDHSGQSVLFKRQVFDYNLTDPTFWDYYDDKKPAILRTSDMETKDKEVIRAIEASWVDANKTTWSNREKLDVFNVSDFSVIDRLRDEFYQNNVVYIDLARLGLYAHAIIGYGMEQDTYNPNILRLNVYDNNLPDDSFVTRQTFEDDGELVTRVTGYKPVNKEFAIYRYPQKVLTTNGLKVRDAFDYRFCIILEDGSIREDYCYMSFDDQHKIAVTYDERDKAAQYQKRLNRLNTGSYNRVFGDQVMFFDKYLNPIVASEH